MEFHKLADVGRWGTAWQRGKDWSANTANGIAIGKIHSNAALRGSLFAGLGEAF